jgi:dolichol-phosphate mannosyltransferase
MPETCVVIPTYNEKENIADLIHAIEALKMEKMQIVVVDDNSPDGTAQIVEGLNNKYRNITVVKRAGKEGIGSAIIAGIGKSLEFKDCKYIVTMDGDFSHDPKEMSGLLDAAKEGVDLVQGSRYLKGGKIVGWPFRRKLVSFGANLLCRILFRFGMTENTTFYRVYSRRLAEKIVEMLKCTGFELAIKTAFIAKKNKFIIKEVPITFTERQKGKSKLKPSHILRWIGSILKLFFKSLFEK